MNIYELLNKRISVRKYLPDDVDAAIVERILEGVRMSPSACNLQPWHFIVVRDKELKEQVADNWKWAAEAPYIIVACGRRDKAWVRACDNKNHVDVDIAIAMQNLVLLATEEGLGTCWICAYDVEQVRKALNLEGDLEPIVMTPLGFPQTWEKERIRKDIKDIVEWR